MLADKYERISPDKIIIKREERQRREIEVEDLLLSIKTRGIINPIIINPDYELIAGERRLAAAKKLGLPSVPVRFTTELSSIELQIIELEENIKRKDLPWQDNCRAVTRIHELYSAQDETWTQAKTANELGFTDSYIAKILNVAKELDKEHISSASTFLTAVNTRNRLAERKVADAIGSIVEMGTKIFEQEQEETKPPEPSILNVDFMKWVETYEGLPFNFIHCDFPFGINVFAGKQANTTASQDTYTDRPDTYWELLNCLCKNLDRVMSQSAHLMFWFSFDYYEQTKEFLRRNAPSLAVQNCPLFWVKSDNVGILSDPKRRPRNIVEQAFIASREDRFLVKATSNAYSAPTDKLFHPSTKPEPMLRVFFQMFVDENTRLLDPTCGSGSALRAAESLGAGYVLGLERDPKHFEAANIALKKARALAAASSRIELP